jgi:tetratricopeptide (TPR) repeat protein
LGRFSESKSCYDQALILHQAAGNRAGEAQAQHNLGKVYRSLGQYQVAQDLLERALVFYQTINDHFNEAYSLYHLGFLHVRQGNHDTALVFLREALELLEELKAPWWAWVKALIYYSWTLLENGWPEQAKVYITEALEVERDTGQKVDMIEDMVLLGRVSLVMGEAMTAKICAQHMLKFLELNGVQGVEHPAMLYLTLYQILQADGDQTQAGQVLAQGQQHLAAQATQIQEPDLRESFLNNVSENRDLSALTMDH